VTAILAIDAAWTVAEPSGIALLRGTERGWACIGLAPSRAQFVGLGDGTPVDWAAKPAGQEPDGSELVTAARVLLDGADIDVVTIDMPMSTGEISGRRAADSAVSKEFGARGCGTHSPNAVRPGAIAKVLREQLNELGFPIATSLTRPGTSPALVEVYPHPALLVVMNAAYRVLTKLRRPVGTGRCSRRPSAGARWWRRGMRSRRRSR